MPYNLPSHCRFGSQMKPLNTRSKYKCDKGNIGHKLCLFHDNVRCLIIDCQLLVLIVESTSFLCYVYGKFNNIQRIWSQSKQPLFKSTHCIPEWLEWLFKIIFTDWLRRIYAESFLVDSFGFYSYWMFELWNKLLIRIVYSCLHE